LERNKCCLVIEESLFGCHYTECVVCCAAYFPDCVGVLRFSQSSGSPVKNNDAAWHDAVCVYSLAVPACTLTVLQEALIVCCMLDCCGYYKKVVLYSRLFLDASRCCRVWSRTFWKVDPLCYIYGHVVNPERRAVTEKQTKQSM
jgi:hypothetical protein